MGQDISFCVNKTCPLRGDCRQGEEPAPWLKVSNISGMFDANLGCCLQFWPKVKREKGSDIDTLCGCEGID